MLDCAVVDKANEVKPMNADDVSGWLYQQINQATVNMMADQMPLTMSLAVLQAHQTIEVDIPEHANYFFDANKGDMYRRRNVHFIYELAANTTWMIFGENLNEEMLTAQESKLVINVS
jgi:hypothetical protein